MSGMLPNLNSKGLRYYEEKELHNISSEKQMNNLQMFLKTEQKMLFKCVQHC